jgi:hypothetical protein
VGPKSNLLPSSFFCFAPRPIGLSDISPSNDPPRGDGGLVGDGMTGAVGKHQSRMRFDKVGPDPTIGSSPVRRTFVPVLLAPLKLFSGWFLGFDFVLCDANNVDELRVCAEARIFEVTGTGKFYWNTDECFSWVLVEKCVPS